MALKRINKVSNGLIGGKVIKIGPIHHFGYIILLIFNINVCGDK